MVVGECCQPAQVRCRTRLPCGTAFDNEARPGSGPDAAGDAGRHRWRRRRRQPSRRRPPASSGAGGGPAFCPGFSPPPSNARPSTRAARAGHRCGAGRRPPSKARQGMVAQRVLSQSSGLSSGEIRSSGTRPYDRRKGDAKKAAQRRAIGAATVNGEPGSLSMGFLCGPMRGIEGEFDAAAPGSNSSRRRSHPIVVR